MFGFFSPTVGKGGMRGPLVCVFFMLYIFIIYIYIKHSRFLLHLPTFTPVNYPNVGK